MYALLQLPAWARNQWAGLAVSVAGLTALTSALAPFLDDRHVLAAALGYLLFTLVVSALWGYSVGLSTAVAADLLVNFFFIPPFHRFTVNGTENVVALVVFLAVAVVGASMLALLRRQVALVSIRGAETNVLLNLTQAVARAAGPRQAMEALCNVAARALSADGCAIVQESSGGWEVRASTLDPGSAAPFSRDEAALAAEAGRTGEIVRLRPDRRGSLRLRPAAPSIPLTIVPIPAEAGPKAVLRISGVVRAPAAADPSRLLAAFANEAGLALQRSALHAEAQRAEALTRADEFKSVLLSSVSHDLRSPLAAIQVAIDSLRDSTVDWTEEDRRAFLDTIGAQTATLTRTVGNLLEMSRLEGGVVDVRLEPVEAAAFLADIRQAASGLGREILVEAPPGIWVRADYGLLTQAVRNLVENAAKYSTPGGAIRLSAERSGGAVRLTVADEGPGIAPEDLPHIFEKFYRGARSQRAAGSGLGLAIAAAMITLCGGNIGVQSSASGTAFVLNLRPAAQPA
ncbi:MAG: DUF4118 domain-containing protein [Chloroflexi bacterium]|nr:DUF4118 domain-containing protein [Chloroflexota bacterium]